MNEGLIWWLAIELIGVAVFPLGFFLFRFLPDRGYSFSKVFGLLLMGYLLWAGASAHVVPNARWTIILILSMLAATSTFLAIRQRRSFCDFLRRRWSYLLLVEGLFSAAFAAALYFRSFNPAMESVEPMDMAFINAIVRSGEFPARDPWLSGHGIPVHYFGQLYIASLIKLTGVPTNIGFNLGLALVFALAATCAFGLVYNLIATADGSRRALVFGAVGVLFLLILGNLVGLFELLAAHGFGSSSFYRLVDVQGLDGPSSTTKWYPTGAYWILRAASFTYGGVDRQFPFFSFLLGDLHAHVLAIPLFVMAIAVVVNVWSSGQRLGGRFLIENLPLSAVLALSVGALAFTNIWDVPTLFFLLAVLVLARNYLAAGRMTPVVARDSLAFLLPIGLLAVLLFLPYYLTFSPDTRGLALLEAAHRPPGIALEPVLTRPHHLLYMYLPFLWLAGCFALACVRRHRWSHVEAIRSLAIASLPLTIWFLAVLVRRGPDVGEEISIRGSNWVTLLILVVLLSGLALALKRELAGSPESGGQRSLVVPLIVSAAAILLLLGMELYWMDELAGIRRFRFSTVFRLGYQAWILLSIGGAYALYHLTLRRPLARPRDILATMGWAAVTLTVILAALLYVPAAVFWKTGDFHNPRSLDALALTKRFNGAEYESLMWLRDNVDGTPVVVEAVGSYYTAFGRVSVATGLPTVLGWPEHEAQWRGSEEPLAGRQKAVERIYKTTDPEEALALLRRFDAEYVYVGLLERSQYGEEGMAKFKSFTDVVFQNGEVTIFKVRGEMAASEGDGG